MIQSKCMKFDTLNDDKEIRWPGSSYDDVGPGVREIRIRDAAGIFRVMVVAKFEAAIVVLHCFQKKTEATAKKGKDIAEARYRTIVRERKAAK